MSKPWANSRRWKAGKEACSSSIGISDTSTFAMKRQASSVSGYSSRHFACAFLPHPGDCRSDGAIFGVVSGWDCVDDVWLYVAAGSAVGGCPHALANGGRAVLPGCAR